ncbi:hypothetical protein C0J52_01326 [Blattella germanica]|nr:hypothetical protein C0J52_01326 [Blattella germanica]
MNYSNLKIISIILQKQFLHCISSLATNITLGTNCVWSVSHATAAYGNPRNSFRKWPALTKKKFLIPDN